MEKAKRNRQNAASRARYNAKTYDNILLRVKLDGSDGITRETIKAAADAAGESLNAYVLHAIQSRMDSQK